MLERAVESFQIVVVAEAKKKLTGKEKLSLEVGGVKSENVGITDVADCAEGKITDVDGTEECVLRTRRQLVISN